MSQADDSDDLSRLILAALRNTNAQDYSLEIIEGVGKKLQSLGCYGSNEPKKDFHCYDRRQSRGHGQS